MALVCYHGDNPHPINQERADFILGIIADKERRKILVSIKNEFKTIPQISEETKLSINKVYRKIHELAERNVLISSGKINNHGKKESIYKSKIRKVVTVFEDESMDVKIYSNLRD